MSTFLRNGIKYDFRRIYTNDLDADFPGRYPDNLVEEISNYEAVSSVLAHQLDFDVIHSHDWLTYPAGVFAKEIKWKTVGNTFTLTILTAAAEKLIQRYMEFKTGNGRC